MSSEAKDSKDAVHNRRASIRAPKVGHKKSRKGCQTCKARRVKCDEVTPECGSCARLGLECSYAPYEPTVRSRPKPQPTDTVSTPTIKESPISHQGSPPTSANGDFNTMTFPTRPAPQDSLSEESEQRRYMELRLLHHWMLQVSRSFGITSPPEWKELWYGEVPQVALNHKNVLYAMFSMTATHLIGRGASDAALFQARENYWVWALREQRAAITNLAGSDTDAVAFAALLIAMNALAMLQERPLEPYTPPLDWLEVGRGAFTVMPPPETVADGTGLKVLMEHTASIWQAEPVLSAEMRQEFGAVLNRDLPSTDKWDAETIESYEAALSYICSFRQSISIGEAPDINLRWICMFPFMVARKFVDFVSEGRPRALVILAYFFAVVAQTDALQYLGNAGDRTTAKREIYAIRRILPDEWLSLMTWPLEMIAADSGSRNQMFRSP